MTGKKKIKESGREASAHKRLIKTALMGPPERGPFVRVVGKGFDVAIRVEDSDDREIVRLALEMGERRRYGLIKAL